MPRFTVPWVLNIRGETAALTAEQIQKLAYQFALDEDSLSKLSTDLAWALDPNNRPRSVLELSKTKRERAAVFNGAMKKIARGAVLLDEARKDLRQLNMSTPVGMGRYISPYQHLFSKLIQASVDAEVVRTLFLKAAASGMQTDLSEPADRRKIRDVRRVMVCKAIIRFWAGLGKPVTYTTYGPDNLRTGPLIDFIDAIVRLVTDPSSELSRETLRDEIDDMKQFLERERKMNLSQG